MKPLHLTLALGGIVAVVVAVGAISPAFAQRGEAEAKTPANWSYQIVNGRRVPRGNRVTQADGSWREEVRDGGCTTVRTMSNSGEYRETRQCD